MRPAVFEPPETAHLMLLSGRDKPPNEQTPQKRAAEDGEKVSHIHSHDRQHATDGPR